MADFFSAADLAEFDAIRVSGSPDVGVISRQSGTTDDGHGGVIDNWTTVATVAVKVAALGSTPTEQTVASQLQGQSLVSITVPTGTDVTSKDLIIVGTVQYEIVGTVPHRSFEVRRRVIARAVS